MRGGEAVLETMRAARVFRDVSADRADGLRGGIGGIEVAIRRDALRDDGVDHARLNDDAGIGKIDFENLREAREADDDATFGGQRAATQSGARSARDKGDS